MDIETEANKILKIWEYVWIVIIVIIIVILIILIYRQHKKGMKMIQQYSSNLEEYISEENDNESSGELP